MSSGITGQEHQIILSSQLLTIGISHRLRSKLINRKLRYWDIRAEKELFTWTTPTNELFTSLEQSPTYLTATAGKTVYFINPQTYAVERKITTAYDVSSVSLNVTKTKFVTGGSSELWVRVYDFDSGREMEVYKG